MKILKKLVALLMISSIALSCFVVPSSLTAVALADENNRNLAREVVGEGIVMLKNKNNALPLSSTNTVAFFGKGAMRTGFVLGGSGSGDVYLDYTPPGPADVFSEISKEGKVGFYRPIYESYLTNSSYIPDEAMYNAAAEEADTAVVVITRRNGEGYDMSTGDWYLNSAEKTMLKTVSEKFEKVVVILNCTSVISTDWSLDTNEYGIDVDALLVCNAPGEMGAYGVADVMMGDVTPSGKLSDTYAMDINDYISTPSYSSEVNDVKYTEDIYVGYRYFETFNIPVAYEFGFGLSYTTFDISTDSVNNDGEKITLQVTVKNTGLFAGKETVQVYYSAPQKGEGSAVISKSAVDLIAFEKTKLLAPGESQTLQIAFNIDDMASFDDIGVTGNKSCYVLESGTYDILVGNSVKNKNKQGEYNVSSLKVVKKMSATNDVTLDSRLEADGSYIDPSIPILKDKQIYIKSYVSTVIEAESVSKKDGYIRTDENYGTNGYLSDGINWCNIPSGIVLGNLHSHAGKYFYYDLYVQKAGIYKLGFIASNGNGNGANENKHAEDFLTLEYSIDGTTWNSVNDFAYDSLNTRINSDYSNKYWFNFVYTDSDLQGNAYKANLPAGEVQIRFKVDPNVNTSTNYYANTNIDKLIITPEDCEFGMTELFELYGLESPNIIRSDVANWIEAENVTNKGSSFKIENFGANGYLFNGTSYQGIDSGCVIGNMNGSPSGTFYYDVTVEEAGTYKLGFIAANGNANGYNENKDADDLLTLDVSTDGGLTYTNVDGFAFDAINTYNGILETGSQWFNFVYTTSDKEGNAYEVTFPKGKSRLRFTVDSTVNNSTNYYCNCNLDKIVLIPEGVNTSIKDVCSLYGIKYSEIINDSGATWYDGSSFAATSGQVRTESYNANSGYLHDGTVYVSLPAGEVVGWFDKAAGGYAEYNLKSSKAGTYNLGVTIGCGSSKIKETGKGYDVVDVYISSDGGANWVKQCSLDTEYTGKDVTGTSAQYWNFKYATKGHDDDQYIINLPKGDFKMRFVSNNNSVTYGGANIDKFVIYPQTISYDEQDVLKYYFNTDGDIENDDSEVEIPDVDYDKDNYVGITYENVKDGSATWDELISQMSYNELLDLSYGHYGDWGYGYTGYIGWSNDDTAEKYGIYAGETGDGGQGLRMQYKNSTYLPNATLQACTWNVELIRELGEIVGNEAIRNNIDMWLAPGLNIHRNPLCGRNFEYYSEDPVLSGLIAAGMVNGVESKGVACTIKHFAANNKESNRKFSNSLVSEKALREIYFKSFEICIKESDPICLMTSYNMINGTYTSASDWVIKSVLRTDFGYEGLIMSDWTTTPTPTPEINAGNNCHMLGNDDDPIEIRKNIALGIITRETLEENAYYILSNLAKMPDNAINPYKIKDVAAIGNTRINTVDYSRKSQTARIVKNGDFFDVPGTKNYFYEYKINVLKSGTYEIDVEYSSVSDVNNAFEIYVNEQKIEINNSIISTGSLISTNNTQKCAIELEAGNYNIKIKHIADANVNYRSLTVYGETVKLGDVNIDGNVDVRDLVRIKKIVANLLPQTEYADIDKDGNINACDIASLRNILLNS